MRTDGRATELTCTPAIPDFNQASLPLQTLDPRGQKKKTYYRSTQQDGPPSYNKLVYLKCCFNF
jgi:hypothetical protein